MAEIFSYFIKNEAVQNAPAAFDSATLKATFAYTIAHSQNIFTLYYNNTHPDYNFLYPLIIFTPIVLAFQLNQTPTQTNLIKISRNPYENHNKNPFIHVVFSPYKDDSRHWCALPDDLTTRITIFANNRLSLFPPPPSLYSTPHLAQFTHLSNPNHTSFKYPRILAIKQGNSVIIPPLSIYNGITSTTLTKLKDAHGIRLFIAFDDSETRTVGPNITPQDCVDNDVHDDATLPSILTFASNKHANLLKPTGDNPESSQLLLHTDNDRRLGLLLAGAGSVLIHGDRFSGLTRQRAVSLARSFASRNPHPIEAHVLLPLHSCADTLALATDLNPLLTSILYAASITFYLNPVPTTIYDPMSHTNTHLGDPIRFAVVTISSKNRPKTNDLLPREISLGSEPIPDDAFYDSSPEQSFFHGFIGLPSKTFRNLVFPNTLPYRLQLNRIRHSIFHTPLTNLYTILKIQTTKTSSRLFFQQLLDDFTHLGLFYMHLRTVKTPSSGNNLICSLRLGNIGGPMGVCVILQSLAALRSGSVPVIEECFPLINQVLKIRLAAKIPNAIALVVHATRSINTHRAKEDTRRPFHSLHHQGRVISLLPHNPRTVYNKTLSTHPSTPSNSFIYSFDDVPLLSDTLIKSTLTLIDPTLSFIGWFYTNDSSNPKSLLLAHSPNPILNLENVSRIRIPNSAVVVSVTRIPSIPSRWTADEGEEEEPQIANTVFDKNDDQLTDDMILLINDINDNPIPDNVLAELATHDSPSINNLPILFSEPIPNISTPTIASSFLQNASPTTIPTLPANNPNLSDNSSFSLELAPNSAHSISCLGHGASAIPLNHQQSHQISSQTQQHSLIQTPPPHQNLVHHQHTQQQLQSPILSDSEHGPTTIPASSHALGPLTHHFPAQGQTFHGYPLPTYFAPNHAPYSPTYTQAPPSHSAHVLPHHNHNVSNNRLNNDSYSFNHPSDPHMTYPHLNTNNGQPSSSTPPNVGHDYNPMASHIAPVMTHDSSLIHQEAPPYGVQHPNAPARRSTRRTNANPSSQLYTSAMHYATSQPLPSSLMHLPNPGSTTYHQLSITDSFRGRTAPPPSI